jgi:putative colanic acid biosynthesis acetyltransferase WcaF
VILPGADPFIGPSFSMRNRVRRQIWSLVWAALFRPSPRVWYAWRNLLLRIFGAQLGKGVHFNPSVQVWAPWNMEVDDYVGVGQDVILYSMAKIVLEHHAVISQGSHLCTGSHDYNSPNFQLVARPIRIGCRAWLCADSFVGPGAEIAEGCVVGARTVVVNPIRDPWTVWVGSPARVVGRRTPSAGGLQ